MLTGSIRILTLTLTVNINPCMRYDGYYLLSDYWDTPGRFLVGEASLEAEPQSLVSDIGRRFPGLLVRESGL